MQFHPLSLSGCFAIQAAEFCDERGWFVKPYFVEEFQKHGISFRPTETFYSDSAMNVVRGMHFQSPPKDHQKLVFCLTGRVLDVGLDLRKNSPTYGKCFSQELSRKNTLGVYFPKGFAHGFCALEPNSLVGYLTDVSYSPEHDSGVKWDSFGFQWPTHAPVVSKRDQSFKKLGEFQSPF